jgi:coatomer subunit gamma
MSEISDEFKIIMVDAICSLCLKSLAKQALMLGFLAGVLCDKGAYDFKQVVEAIFDMIKFIKDGKEAALRHLCEFIWDCKFTKLSVWILHLLLENTLVWAAAVSSLAKFGINVVDIVVKQSIGVLLSW